jgi:TonB-linked SusC/RagA family outer membrane protein
MIKIYTQFGSGFRKTIFPIKREAGSQLLKNICCSLLLFLPMLAFAQTGAITGTVKDSKGVAVIGATVKEKGASNTSVTDVDGKFHIVLKKNSGILIVSFIGYVTKEVPIGNSSDISIVLEEDLNKLNEVVVVGYGTVKKSDVTGSVSSIKGSDLNLGGSVSNVGEAIQGKAAGVLVQQTNFAPGGGIAVTIRGGNSINASNEPLYVIDGFISDYGNLINPNDIADIQILKDASATAIYGSRGANGVVLITTKKGTPGQVSIDADVSNGWQYDTYKPALLTGQQYTDIQNATAIEDGKSAPYGPGFIPANTNWLQAAIQTATVDNRSVSVSSNNKDSKIYASVNYLNQVGVLKNTDFQKYSARLGAEKTLNDNIKIGANFYGSSAIADLQSYSGDITAPIFGLLVAPPNVPVYKPDGSFNIFYNPQTGGNGNPIYSLLSATNNTQNKFGNGNIYLDYSLLKNLTYHVSAGAEYNQTIAGQYSPNNSAEGLTNPGMATDQWYSTFRWLVENYFTYKFKIKNDNDFTVLLGNSNQKDVDQGLSAGSQGYSTNEFLFYNLTAGSIANSPGSYRVQTTGTDYYTRINYAFQDKLLATFTLRDDGSSRFGPQNSHGIFPSGAIAYKLGDESFIKNLNTFSDLKIRVGYGVTGNDRIPQANAYLSTFSPWNTVLAPGGPLQVGIEPASLSNPALKWESTAQFDAGLDMGFLDGRINATLDVYRKTTSNLLLNVPVGNWWGANTEIVNAGSIQNQGIELAINTVNVKSAGFSWTSSFNGAYNIQKVLSLAPGISAIYSNTANPSGTVSGAQFTKIAVGQELGEFYGYEYTGVLKTGQTYAPEPNAKPGDPLYKDLNGDGLITPADQTYLGNSNPHYTAALGNNFSYKGFGLSIFFQGAFDYDLYNMNALVLESTTGAAALNRFVPGVNENTNIPREGYFLSQYGGYVNSKFVQNASYVRLKTMSFSYTIPPSIFTRTPFIRGLSIYAEGQNLLTFTGYKGTDPEENVHQGQALNAAGGYSGSNITGGLDFGGFPAFRTYIVGIKLSVH